MDSLARAFDLPVESDEHRQLAETAWMGGESVTVRYWLGRLLQHNFFRDSDESLTSALQQYFENRGYQPGSILVVDCQAWGAAARLLQRDAAEIHDCAAPENPRLTSAIEAIFVNPNVTDAELAAIASNSEQQIKKMPEVSLLRKLWELSKARD